MCTAATLEAEFGPITLNVVTRVTINDNNQAEFTLNMSTVAAINALCENLAMANKDKWICGL